MRAALCLIGLMLLASPMAASAQETGSPARPQAQSGLGGVYLRLEADVEAFARSRAAMAGETPADAARALGQAMDATREIIARRIAGLGAGEASIVRQGASRILVQVAGVRDPAAIRALIVPAARVELRLVDESATPEQVASGEAPAGSRILPFAEDEEGSRIAVRQEALVTGDMIASAQQGFDELIELPVVTIAFTDEGRRRFARATAENVGKRFAIVVDDVVISAPNINEPILGGTAQISGSFTVESANRLAIWLGSGALPVRLAVIEERALPR